MTTTDALRARILAATRPAPSMLGPRILGWIGIAGIVVTLVLWGLT